MFYQMRFDPAKYADKMEFKFDPKLFWIKNLQQGSHIVFDTASSNKTLAFDLKRGYEEHEEGLIKNNRPASSFESYIAAFGDKPLLKVKYYKGNGNILTVPVKSDQSPEVVMIKNLSRETDWFYWQSALGYRAYMRLNNDQEIIREDRIFAMKPPNKHYMTLGKEKIVNRKDDEYMMILFFRTKQFTSGTYIGKANIEVSTKNKPNMLIIKRMDGIGTWRMFSTVFNSNDSLRVNSFGALTKKDDLLDVKLLNNGFSISSNAPAINAEGSKYLYLCFTETSM